MIDADVTLPHRLAEIYDPAPGRTLAGRITLAVAMTVTAVAMVALAVAGGWAGVELGIRLAAR